MKKIAFITEYRGLGGGETNLLKICSALSAKYEIGLFCASGKLLETAENIKLPNFKATEIKPVRNLWRNDFPFPLANLGLISSLNKYDIIHSYSPNPLPMLLWQKKPIVWTVHGFWERPYGRRARFINMFVDKVLPVSFDVANLVEIPANKLETIYLGAISTNDIEPNYKPFDGVNLTISCIGSYQHIKGQDVLIDALVILSQQLPDIKITLNLLGDINGNNPSFIEFKELLLKKIADSKSPKLNICVHGFKRNVNDFINSSHFVVVPSRYESFSMVTVEALAKGKQVIAPDIGGPKEILSVPNVGILFIPGDPTSLCEKLVSAISNYPEDYYPETLERANDFTIEKQLSNLERVYDKL